MIIPAKTVDLLKVLKEAYKDEMETDPKLVGTPDYFKKAGVIELIKTIEVSIEQQKTTVQNI